MLQYATPIPAKAHPGHVAGNRTTLRTRGGFRAAYILVALVMMVPAVLTWAIVLSPDLWP